ncbi:MAG: class I SAM-dependent methyltransferase [Firmicutes bacterium]|nr:class I SAM-dependent methyltransferase [Bacillota bacterium]
MSEHYFTPDPKVGHGEREFTVQLRGMTFTFVTDRGVFSRGRVDFGTRLLIENMDFPPDAVILDLGCGYGPIGVVAARLAPRGHVYMVDINERAVRLAEENLARNGIRNATVRVGDGLGAVPGIAFDAILLNPPVRAGKATVWRLLAEAEAALRPGGSLWVVIGNKQGAPSLKRRLQELFPRVEDVDRKAGFHIYRGVKAGPASAPEASPERPPAAPPEG